jgi:hypothetical protein
MADPTTWLLALTWFPHTLVVAPKVDGVTCPQFRMVQPSL